MPRRGWRAAGGRFAPAGIGLFLALALPARAGDAPSVDAAFAGRRPPAEHVVLISIDGLRADAIRDDTTPNLRALAARGASCPSAETIRPSVTLPSHTAMLTGFDYARHGVTWNDYRPGCIELPTVFSVAHDAGRSTALLFGKSKFRYLARPGSVDWLYGEPPPPSFPLFGRTIYPSWAFGVMVLLHVLAMAGIWLFLGAAWRNLGEEPGGGGPAVGKGRHLLVGLALAGPILYAIALFGLREVPIFYGSLVRAELEKKTESPKGNEEGEDEKVSESGAEGLAKAFARVWPERRFDLTFVHLRDPDEKGHRSGWMGPAYLKAIGRCDRAVGEIVEAVRTAGLLENTAILVTADHGGSGRRHYTKGDPDKPEHVRIPWICAGPGVPAGLVIGRIVRVYDTAPTVLAFLGLPPPPGIDGRAVDEVLKP